MIEKTVDPQLVFVIGSLVTILLGAISYGVYLTLGSGSKDLRDPIDEHAKMHELGIAHGHSTQRIKK